MAEIKVDSKEVIEKLRKIVKSEDLFPYADYDVNDPNTYVTITFYKKGDDGFKYGSRDFEEEHDGILPLPLRAALFDELTKYNPDQELIKELESIGITLKFPQKKSGGWFK